MTKLYLNTNSEFTITGFSRYTNVQDDKVYSNANVYFPDTSEYSELEPFMETEITDIKIKVDGTEVYHLSDISAVVTAINESLDVDAVHMNATISFDMETPVV